MISKKMEKALCGQIQAELYSAYLYLAMAAYFRDLNLDGFVNWMKCQTLEEEYHAMKIYGHIEERAGRVTLEAIEMPPKEWASPLAAFEAAYAHERKITGMINDLVDLARKEKDHATDNFLQWYVAEQVEEENQTDAISRKLKLVGGKGEGLLMVDQELAARVFTLYPDIKVVINPAPAGGAVA